MHDSVDCLNGARVVPLSLDLSKGMKTWVHIENGTRELSYWWEHSHRCISCVVEDQESLGSSDELGSSDDDLPLVRCFDVAQDEGLIEYQ